MCRRREFHDAVVRHRLVTVADEHVAVRCDDDVRGAIEMRRAVAGMPRRAEAHQLAAVRRELDDLVAAMSPPRASVTQMLPRGVDVDPVRPGEHAGAESAEPLAFGADMQDRVDVAVRGAIVRAATLGDPQRTVWRDVDHAHRAQRSVLRRGHPARQRAVRIRRRLGSYRPLRAP